MTGRAIYRSGDCAGVTFLSPETAKGAKTPFGTHKGHSGQYWRKAELSPTGARESKNEGDTQTN
jgi:hypothetical protein